MDVQYDIRTTHFGKLPCCIAIALVHAEYCILNERALMISLLQTRQGTICNEIGNSVDVARRGSARYTGTQVADQDLSR